MIGVTCTICMWGTRVCTTTTTAFYYSLRRSSIWCCRKCCARNNKSNAPLPRYCLWRHLWRHNCCRAVQKRHTSAYKHRVLLLLWGTHTHTSLRVHILHTPYTEQREYGEEYMAWKREYILHTAYVQASQSGLEKASLYLNVLLLFSQIFPSFFGIFGGPLFFAFKLVILAFTWQQFTLNFKILIVVFTAKEIYMWK